VHKGNEVTIGSRSGLFVDQLNTGGGESGEFRRNVICSVGDVM
jgi:hypothetical protein